MSVEAEAPPASTMPSLKRPHPDNEAAMGPATPVESRQSSPSPASTALSSPANIATPKDTPMATSTNPSSISNSPSKAPQSSTVTATQGSILPAATPQSSSAPPAKKRRKLTPAEKAEQEAEKAKKAAERAEAAAKRDAEKQAKEAERAAKDEEKRKKAEAKELEQKLKEEVKQAKEEEKRAKEEEKKAKEEEKKVKQEAKEAEKRKKEQEKAEKEALKKFKEQEKEDEIKKREASQMRLSSFFSLPKASSPAAPLPKTLKASASPSKHNFITKDEARRRSMSLDPVDFEPPTPTKSRPVADLDKQASKVDKGFLPFVPGKNMRLAPINAFLPADDELVRVMEAMDKYPSQPVSEPRPTVKESFAKLRKVRGYQPPKVAQVIQKLHGSQSKPIDLTSDTPMDMLRSIPIKYFHYGEDVRPPYKGTWTRPVDQRLARKLSLRPLAQELPEVVYDYDSEAEWDDADEGEDIDIDGEEEEEDDEEGEMEGFLDDDNAPQYLARRGLPAIDVEPVCSGLQWQCADGKMKSADPKYEDANFKEFEICFLLDPSPKTIDPFTTAYWDPEPKQISTQGQLPLTSSMGPPRLPLSDRTNGQASVQSTLVNGKVPKAAKIGPRMVPPDVLPAFRAAIDGSDMTKIALIEHLKKQFPKLGKAQITETLPLVAQRVGAKQADKKWQLIAEVKV